MELTDYIRAMGRRLLVVLILPAVAAGAGYAILSRQPIQHRATATVRLPVAADAPTAVVIQANSDFIEALSSVATRASTSQATGVTRRAIRKGLAPPPPGSRRVVTVTFTTSRRVEAEAVVTTAAHSALTDLLEPDVALKQEVVDTSKARYDASRAALAALDATGATLVEDQYRQKLGQVSQLELQLLQERATDGTTNGFGRLVDNSQAIDAFTAAIAAAQAEVVRLTGLVAQVRPAEDAVQTALSNLGTAERALDAAKAALASLEAPDTIVASPVTKVDKADNLIRTLAVIVSVAVVLAVGLLVLLELLWPSSRRRERITVPDEDPPAPPQWGEADKGPTAVPASSESR